MWSKHQPHVKKVADDWGLKFLPLYTTPPEAAPRQPLTEAQVMQIVREAIDCRDAIRRAEAAHGIGVATRLPADDTGGGEEA